MLQMNAPRRAAIGLASVAVAVALAVPALAANPGSPAKGKVVFVANCGACHTLKAAKATGMVGPNLDQKKPAYAKVVLRVTNGKGAMPPLKATLSKTQIQDVAAFVYASTHM
jgi:mono/diheme cytochrome c family protein